MSVRQQGQADNIRDTVRLKIEASHRKRKRFEVARETSHFIRQGSGASSVDLPAKTSNNTRKKTWIVENMNICTTIQN